jgi:hypothetical protein
MCDYCTKHCRLRLLPYGPLSTVLTCDTTVRRQITHRSDIAQCHTNQMRLFPGLLIPRVALGRDARDDRDFCRSPHLPLSKPTAFTRQHQPRQRNPWASCLEANLREAIVCRDFELNSLVALVLQGAYSPYRAISRATLSPSKELRLWYLHSCGRATLIAPCPRLRVDRLDSFYGSDNDHEALKPWTTCVDECSLSV